ncbi:MAG: autotransporter domain-containing protein, partial [Proteobacteria bacterium]|nr:autotransporter domain-containing protein [Pseudomonadota bacterium]
ATTGTALEISTGGITTLTNTNGTITSAATAGGATHSTVAVTGDLGAGGLSFGGTVSNTETTNNSGIALDIASAQSGTITNTGTLSASGSTSTHSGTAVDFAFAGPQAFTNTGTVLGNIIDGGVASVATITESGTMTGNITLIGNAVETIIVTGGTLTGNISTGNANDTITHTGGTITGNIALGSGTDVFTQTAGTVTGNLTGGTGTDTLNLGGGQIVGTTTLGTGANVVNVTGTYTIGGTIGSGGSIALTTQNGGTLNVDNTITTGAGNIAVNGGGTLNLEAASVTSTGSVTNTGTTTIAAGQTLTAATQVAAAGTYGFAVSDIAGIKTEGKLALTGGAINLGGATINAVVTPASGYIPSGSTFLVASGTAVATTPIASGAGLLPQAVGSSSSALYTFKYATGDNAAIAGGTNQQVYLIATRLPVNSTLGAAITPNDTTTNATLVTIGTTGNAALNTTQGVVASSTTAAAVHSNLQALTPTIDGGAQSSALNIGSDTQEIAETRMAALRSGDASGGVAAGVSANGVSMWIEGHGQHAIQDVRNAVEGYHSNTWGSAIGVDSSTLMNDGILGFAINYGRTSIDSQNANTTTTDLNNYGFNFYGAYKFDQQTFVNGQAGYAYNTIDSDRHNADLAGATAHGSTHSDQYSAKLSLGRDYPSDHGLTLTPMVSAAYTDLNTAGYAETGAGGADLVVGSNSQNVFDLGIGANVGWKLKNNVTGAVMNPALHVGYAYDLVGDKVQATSSFSGDPAATAFTTTGTSPARSIFDAGANVVYMTPANWEFSANYDFQYKQDYTSHTGEVRATSHF